MKKTLTLAYAGFAYALAMASIAYIIGFLADFGVPKTVNSGQYYNNLWTAVAVNAALVLAFGLHHSITARRSFKARWTRLVPAHLERATYLYMTAIATGILVVLWQPIPITVWQIDADWAAALVIALYLGVWGMMFAATFLVGHLSFFGFAQAWSRVREAPPPNAPFTARYLYAIVRHPISLGWMLVPWLTPHLTVGQLVFALTTTAYVLVATWFEEADLVAELGDQYHDYRRKVPAFVPRLRMSRTRPPEADARASDQ